MTQKESGKIRSLYFKEGLHLLLGRGLGMKSPARIKKTYFANYTADPTTDSFTPAQESCQTVQREFKESHTNPGLRRCKRLTVQQRTTKMVNRFSWNVHLSILYKLFKMFLLT